MIFGTHFLQTAMGPVSRTLKPQPVSLFRPQGTLQITYWFLVGNRGTYHMGLYRDYIPAFQTKNQSASDYAVSASFERVSRGRKWSFLRLQGMQGVLCFEPRGCQRGWNNKDQMALSVFRSAQCWTQVQSKP